MRSHRLVTLQVMFKRYRRPGDIVFALVFLLFSIWLLTHLSTQTTWKPGAKLVAQARFWPMIGVVGMVFFGSLHAIGSLLSPRIPGRWKEISLWLRSVEYALWFMVYVILVPILGYLIVTILICFLLALRAGYRSRKMLVSAVVAGVVVVIVFKSFLQVKLPGGQVYEYLPTAPRSFMLTYF